MAKIFKPTITTNFETIGPDDDQKELERKLSGKAGYIVSYNQGNNQVNVMRKEVAMEVYKKARNVVMFHKTFASRAVPVAVVGGVAAAAQLQHNAFALMKRNNVQKIGFNVPLPNRVTVKANVGKLTRPAVPSRVVNSGKLPAFPKRQFAKKAGDTPKSEPFYLNAKYPTDVKLKTAFELQVRLSEIAETAANIPMMIERESKIDVFLQPLKGFETKGRQDVQLVAGGTPEQTSFRFQLLPTELGEGKLRLYALQEGKFLGKMEVSIKIIGSAANARVKEDSRELVQPQGRVPDLQLMIFEQRPTNNEVFINFRISVSTPSLKIDLQNFDAVKLTASPYSYMNDLFKEIEQLNMTVFEDKETAISKLERFGADLYETLMPLDLRKMLWSIKDKVKTISITSDEPFIPWEICRLTNSEDGRTEEAGYLSELFEVTRWMPGVDTVSPSLNLIKWGLVIPEDSNLKHAVLEKKALHKLGKARNVECIDVPPKYKDVLRLLQGGEISLWHFAGHGSFQDNTNPDQSLIHLNKKEQFKPNYIAGVVKNLGMSHPLVFLNACQAGKPGMSLTGIGGWASRFIGSGASVFVGAYWEVLDDAAFAFSQEFYNGLFKKKLAVGKAVLEARKKVKSFGDPTWLAYTVYANPYAKVEG